MESYLNYSTWNILKCQKWLTRYKTLNTIYNDILNNETQRKYIKIIG